MVGRESLPALVNIGSLGGNTHRLTFVHQFGHLGDVVHVAAHHGCHILGWIVGLEVTRLVGHPRIARGMRLVEGIGGEFLPVGPNLFKHLRVVAVALSALDELRLHGIYDVFLLLTHCLTKGIALASGEVGQLTGKQHDLLLIDGYAVGILQILLHAGNVVGDFLPAVLSGDERRDVVHWTRTVKGIHSDEVFEDRGMQLAQVFLHARGFELERSYGAASLIQLVGEGVVDGNRVEVDFLARVMTDILDGFFQNGERFQSEEVHLDESRRFNDVAVVLRTVKLMSGIFLVLHHRDRHPVGDGVATDDEATGMDTRAAHGSLKHLGILHGVAHVLVGRDNGLLQFGHTLDGIG